MKDLINLIKIDFKKGFKFDKSKKILYICLYLYLAVVIAVGTSMYVKNTVDILKPLSLENSIITLFYILGMFTTFLTAVFKIKGSLFNVEDLTLSLPIKHSTILMSKMVVLYIYTLITSLVFTLPSFITYGVITNISCIYYILLGLTLPLMPMLPLILAGVIGYLITLVTRNFKCKNLSEMLGYLVFIGIVVYIQFNGMNFVNYITSKIGFMMNVINNILKPVGYLEEILITYDIIALFKYIILNLGSYILFIYLFKGSYVKTIQRLNINKVDSNYKVKKHKMKNEIMTLFNVEAKRYFTTPIYVFNTGFLLVIAIIGSISTKFIDKEIIFTTLNQIGISIELILLLLVIMIASISNTSSTAISLEGSRINLLKTLPVNPKKILIAKGLFNVELICIPVFISLIILKFTLSISVLNIVIIMLVTIILSICTSIFGLIINLLIPKLVFKNPVEVVKQSTSVMVVSLTSVMISMITISLTLALGISMINLSVIIIIIALILIVVGCNILSKWGVKRFKTL